MRSAFGATGWFLSPSERLATSDWVRVRKFVGDLLTELGNGNREIPNASTNENPEDVANKLRKH